MVSQKFSEQLSELIAELHNNYPIGIIMPNFSYAGYKNVLLKTEVKINRLIRNESFGEWDNFFLDIKEQFKEYEINAELEKQFPNYAFSIVLKKNETQDFFQTCKFKFRLSLLCDFYTLFFEEEFLHKNISSNLEGTNPLLTKILHSKLIRPTFEIDQQEIVKEVVKKYFSRYKFVPHFLLFSRKVRSGNPHGLENDGFDVEYPIYTYLFDNEYGDLEKVTVAP